MKKKIIPLALMLPFFSIILTLIIKNTYANPSTETKEFTREELQEIVVSTALSYLHNNKFTDYEQKPMDKSTNIDKETGEGSRVSFSWRSFEHSPEKVSRVNPFYVDCSTFVSTTYIHSLGYDFSEFYKKSPTNVFYNSEKMALKTSKENFQIGYKLYGGLSTNYFSILSKEEANVNAGTEYINDSQDNENVVVYFYEVNKKETAAKINTIKNHIIDILQPGDVIMHRKKSTDSDGGDNSYGHTLIYIGNKLDSSSIGYIHANGKDYKFDDLIINNDKYSVRYDDFVRTTNNFETVINNGESGSVITVLRPINKFCTKEDDKCEIPICLDGNCDIGYLNKNSEARADLNGLRIEQYTKIEKEYHNNFTEKPVTNEVNKSISEYNSVNIGDKIKYSLYILNKSDMYYCTDGDYDNKTDCENAKKDWKQRSTTGTTYKNLTITNKVPENTKFIECEGNTSCTYDANTNTVTWNLPTFGKDGEVTLRYYAEIIAEKNIVNEGMKILTNEGNTLQMEPITTKVNPTINGINIDLLKEEITKFKNLVSDGKITYSNSDYAEYKQDLDTVTSINMTRFGFIKMIYYNALGIDIGEVTGPTIKNALFKESSHKEYQGFQKKTEVEILKLTNDNYININKMLVKGMYGGRELKGNDNLDRARYLRPDDLEVGDILIGLYQSDNSTTGNVDSYMFIGLEATNEPIFVRFESSGLKTYNSSSSKTGFTLFKEIYARNLFVVLRPSQLYGTTIKYEYNNATTIGDSSYVAYDTYRNLTTPSKENTTINLVYNKELTENIETTFTINHTFDGWYSDKNLTNKINNSTKLISTSAHDIYAKWNSTTITLPNASAGDDYELEGWYNDASLTNKVGNAGENYTSTTNSTLYAKWIKKDDGLFFISDSVIIKEGIISNIELGTTFNELIAKISTNANTIEFLDKEKNELIKDKMIKTGDILRLNNQIEYKLVVAGDITGDGDINIADVAKLYQYIKNKITMDKEFIAAGEFITDDIIDELDVEKLYQYIKEKH